MGKPKQTRGKKSKLVLVFDEEQRQEYLTGFRKRKNERRKKAQDELKVLLADEKKKQRQEHREKIMRSSQQHMDRLQEAEELVEAAEAKAIEAGVKGDGDVIGHTGDVTQVFRSGAHTLTVAPINHLASDSYLGTNTGFVPQTSDDKNESDGDESAQPSSKTTGKGRVSADKQRLTKLESKLLKLTDPKNHKISKHKYSAKGKAAKKAGKKGKQRPHPATKKQQR